MTAATENACSTTASPAGSDVVSPGDTFNTDRGHDCRWQSFLTAATENGKPRTVQQRSTGELHPKRERRTGQNAPRWGASPAPTGHQHPGAITGLTPEGVRLHVEFYPLVFLTGDCVLFEAD